MSILQKTGGRQHEIDAMAEDIAACDYKETIVAVVREELKVKNGDAGFAKTVCERFLHEFTLAEKLQQHPPDEKNFAYTGKDGRKVRLLLSQALQHPYLLRACFGCIGARPARVMETVGAVISSCHRGAKMILVIYPANVVPMWAGSRGKDDGVYRRGEVQNCYRTY